MKQPRPRSAIARCGRTGQPRDLLAMPRTASLAGGSCGAAVLAECVPGSRSLEGGCRRAGLRPASRKRGCVPRWAGCDGVSAHPRASTALSTPECLGVLEHELPDIPLRQLTDVLTQLERVAFASAHGADVAVLAERARALARELAP